MLRKDGCTLIIEHQNQKIKVYLDQMIGQGSFGKVYLSERQEFSQDCQKCATKILYYDTNNKIDIEREIKVITEIEAENIVDAYFAAVIDDEVYIVSEFCEQGTLRRYCENNNLSVLEMMNLFKKILDGYKKLKEKNIIHRDIKDENILMKNGTPKIADFGLAKFTDDSNQQINHTLHKGSPIFSSPQVILEQNYSYKVDIYSLGVVLYKMIYKKFPFNKNIHNYGKLRNYFKSLEQNSQEIQITFDDKPAIIQEIKDVIHKMMSFQECGRINLEDLISQVKKIIFKLQDGANQQNMLNVTPQGPQEINTARENLDKKIYQTPIQQNNNSIKNQQAEQINKNIQLPSANKSHQLIMDIQGNSQDIRGQQQAQQNSFQNNNLVANNQNGIQRNSFPSFQQDINYQSKFGMQAQQDPFTNNNYNQFLQQNYDSVKKQNYFSNNNNQFLQQDTNNLKGGQPGIFQHQIYYQNNTNNIQQQENNQKYSNEYNQQQNRPQHVNRNSQNYVYQVMNIDANQQVKVNNQFYPQYQSQNSGNPIPPQQINQQLEQFNLKNLQQQGIQQVSKEQMQMQNNKGNLIVNQPQPIQFEKMELPKAYQIQQPQNFKNTIPQQQQTQNNQQKQIPKRQFQTFQQFDQLLQNDQNQQQQPQQKSQETNYPQKTTAQNISKFNFQKNIINYKNQTTDFL